MAKIFCDPDSWVHYCMMEDRDNFVDPATVELKIVNHVEVQRYSRIIAKDSADKTIQGQATVIQNVSKKQFEEHVRNPSNFFRLDVNKKPVEMKTAADLFDYSDSETINELIRAMESNSKMTEGQKKTLSSLSDMDHQT